MSAPSLILSENTLKVEIDIPSSTSSTHPFEGYPYSNLTQERACCQNPKPRSQAPDQSTQYPNDLTHQPGSFRRMAAPDSLSCPTNGGNETTMSRAMGINHPPGQLLILAVTGRQNSTISSCFVDINTEIVIIITAKAYHSTKSDVFPTYCDTGREWGRSGGRTV